MPHNKVLFVDIRSTKKPNGKIEAAIKNAGLERNSCRRFPHSYGPDFKGIVVAIKPPHSRIEVELLSKLSYIGNRLQIPCHVMVFAGRFKKFEVSQKLRSALRKNPEDKGLVTVQPCSANLPITGLGLGAFLEKIANTNT